MKTLKKQRARSDADKELRKGALLAAARSLALSRGPDGFSIADVAARARLAKGTIYLYVESREALLLELLMDDLQSFFKSLQEAWSRPATPAEAAEILCSALMTEKLLLPLLQDLHGSIEPGLSLEAVEAFKAFLAHAVDKAGAALERSIALPTGRGVTALLNAYALAIGCAQMANRPPVVEQALARNPALRAFQFDFREIFVPGVTQLWTGMKG